MNTKLSSVAAVLSILAGVEPAMVVAQRPTPTTRDPDSPGFVAAKELPDGKVPPADAEGNFIIGPTHTRAPEMAVQQDVPQGTIHNLTMNSTDSKIYPGITKDNNDRGHPDPTDPA